MGRTLKPVLGDFVENGDKMGGVGRLKVRRLERWRVDKGRQAWQITLSSKLEQHFSKKKKKNWWA
ncbi:MAG: hypothetical protein KC434_20865, partial [Anaerolineales bacterium]|nr:hypothetical protein [Anaerolineales bacterium]